MDDRKLSRWQEIKAEFRTVFAGRSQIIDSLIPPLIFLILNATIGFNLALWIALGSALLVGIWRAIQRQQLSYALAGVGGVLVAVIVARFLGRAEGFFLPGLVSGSLTAGLCLLSLIARRPRD